MRLSPETLNILKNFASISKELFIRPGHTLKTRTLAVYAEAELEERFPVDAPLPDLGAILKALKFVRQPDFNFGKDRLTITEASENAPKAKLNFEYDPNLITLPMDRKNFDQPKGRIEYALSAEDLATLRKAVADFGKADIHIVSDGRTIHVGTDTGKAGYSFPVDGSTNGACKHILNPKNLKLLTGDYSVQTTELYTEFRHRSLPVLYLIAPEPGSTFAVAEAGAVSSQKRSLKLVGNGRRTK